MDRKRVFLLCCRRGYEKNFMGQDYIITIKQSAVRTWFLSRDQLNDFCSLVKSFGAGFKCLQSKPGL